MAPCLHFEVIGYMFRFCSVISLLILFTFCSGAFAIGVPVNEPPESGATVSPPQEFQESRLQLQFIQLVQIPDNLPDAWRRQLLTIAAKPLTWIEPETGELHVFLQRPWENVMDSQYGRYQSKGAVLSKAEVQKVGKGTNWDRIEIELVDIRDDAAAANLMNHLLHRLRTLADLLGLTSGDYSGSPFQSEAGGTLESELIQHVQYAYLKSDIPANADRIMRGPEWVFSVEKGSLNFNEGNLALAAKTHATIVDDFRETRQLYLYLIDVGGLAPGDFAYQPEEIEEAGSKKKSKSLFGKSKWLPKITIQSEYKSSDGRRTEEAKPIKSPSDQD